MKKKLFLFVMFMIFHVFSVPFLYVEAGNDEQPKVCNGPSEMMSNYFNFQRDIKTALLGTEINSVRFSASFGAGGLFTNRVLDLNTTSAIELVSSSVVGNLKSFVSNSLTSMFLLELAVFSVVQSNTEGFAILFADWPIVRDYKTMLDIETELFDIAYFRSMQIDLTRQIDATSADNISKIIKEYKDIGLLTGRDSPIQGSMGDILLDLVQMNAVMKQFIMVGGKNIGKAGLRKYNGCLGNQDIDGCSSEFAIIRFDAKAIDDLYDAYTDVRGPFGGCNSYGNRIKSVLNKTKKNNKDSVSQAMQDVEDALVRLKNVLFEGKRWDFHNPCKDLSAYEMAQLQAYWGGNWKCGYGLNFFTAERYVKDKIAHSQQKKKRSNALKKSKKSNVDGDINNKMKDSYDYSERSQKYKEIIGTGHLSKFYDFDLADGFIGVSNATLDEFFQAQESAVSTDITLFPMIRELLDQVDKTGKPVAEDLSVVLKHLQGKQCKKRMSDM